MGIIAWIIFGLIAGFIASKIVNRQGEGFLGDVILGIIGAVVGGWLFGVLRGQPVLMVFNLASLLVAIAGAVIVLVIYHAVRRV
jgi:uncharacterized membrane protein YeaQ/YmgE (transglycosylase-associated protein family)